MSSAAPAAVTEEVVDTLCCYYDRMFERGWLVDPVDELATFTPFAHAPDALARLAARIASRACLAPESLMSIVSRARVADGTQLGIAYAVCAKALHLADPVDDDIVSGLDKPDAGLLAGAACAVDALVMFAHAAARTPLSAGAWLRTLNLAD